MAQHTSAFLPPAPPLTLSRPALPSRRPSLPSRPSPRRSTPSSCLARPTEASVMALLRTPDKGGQQRGLLLSRQLAAPARLRALVFSITTSANEWVRATATVGLGQLRGADAATRATAIEMLVDLVANDADFSIRSAAAAGCGYLSDDARWGREGGPAARVVDALLKAWVDDGEWQVRFSCLVSLGNLKDERAIGVAVEALESDNDLLVQAAVGACGDLGYPQVVAPLLGCLGSEDMMTRQRLAHALGCFDPPQEAIVDALVTLCHDPSFAVREAAGDSLRRYGLEKPEESDNDGQLEREVAALLAGNSAEDAKKRTEDGAERALRKRLERSFKLGTSEDIDG